MAEDDLDPFEALASSRKIIPLDDSHKAQIEALQRSGYTTLWIADHHLLQTHTCALQDLMEGPEGKELGLVGVFETNSAGPEPRQPQLFPLSLAQRCLAGLPLLARRLGSRYLEPGRPGLDHLLLQPPAGPGDRRQDARRHRRPGQRGYVFKTAEDARKAAKLLGQDDITLDPMFEGRKTTLKAHKDGRLVMEIERRKGDADLKEPEGLACQEDEVGPRLRDRPGKTRRATTWA